MKSILLLTTVSLVAGLCAGTTQAGLLAHYSFDTDCSDSSGNNRHGVAFDGNTDGDTDGASITTADGAFKFGGGAANFTNERDWIDIPTLTIGSGNPYTVTFWARDLSSSPTTGGMVIGQPNNTIFFIWLYQEGNLVRWRGSSNAAERQADFTLATNDQWHHYAFVAGDADGDTGVDDITLYRDGSFVGTDRNNLTGFIFDAIGEAYIVENYNFDFEGQIDEVWLFNEAIDAGKVRSLYYFNVVPEPSSVVLLTSLLLGGLLALGGLGYAGRKA